MADRPADEVTTRVASAADAHVIAEILTEAFEGYRAWAPPDWSPPRRDAEEAFLAPALARSDVWFLLAFARGKAAGHVGLSPFTMVQQEPPPAGTINLWQLFVRPRWQGSGLATELMRAAEAEARRRGFTRMRLWTPRDGLEPGASTSGKAGRRPATPAVRLRSGCHWCSTRESSPTPAEATDDAMPLPDQLSRGVS